MMLVFKFPALMCLLFTIISADDYRLPTTISPESYILNLKFPESAFQEDPSGAIFSGQVTITAKVIDDTSEIKLHASHDFITIKSVYVNGDEFVVKVDATTDIATISKEDKSFTKNDILDIIIEYDGKISTSDNYGIYKSSFKKSGQDETSYVLATQFETTYARRAFPCFDEPSFKATFDLTAVFPDGYDILFNTNKQEEPTYPDEKTKSQAFQKTPKMSTYTLAFVISDFTSLDSEAIDGLDTTLKAWSREGTELFRAYAVEVSPKILKALDDYIGIKFSDDIDKLDQVAVPDFAAGAMENWGLVTYRERLLLFDQDNTVETTKQNIATTIAHEFAHQWFGNIITCNWWSEAYLNEAFASYFEYFIMKELEPTWEIEKLFIGNVVQYALDVDSVETQAIKSEVSTPQEISNKFGDIIYKKGASIVRMIAHIMGETKFKEAIQAYIQSDLKYSTATTEQMLEIFNDKTDAVYSNLPEEVTLAGVMANWIENPGYPLVTVTLDGKKLTVSQERFLVSGQDTESKWYIPITLAESESEVNFQVTAPAQWLTSDQTSLTFELEHNNNWVLLNKYQTGFYRVNYDSNIWSGLSQALLKDNFDGIIEENRAQIVDDLFNLAKVNKLKYSEIFKIIEFLKNETGYFTWNSAFRGFQYLWLRIQSNSELQALVKQHIANLMATFYKTAPITETTNDLVYTQRQILASTWACFLGEETCVAEAQKIFKETVLANNGRPDKNIRLIVYCNALRYSDDTTDVEQLWKLYDDISDNSEQLNILNALACSSSQEKLKELLLETIKDDSKIRNQDSSTVYAAVYSRSLAGVEVTLEFLQENFQKIREKYASMNMQDALIKKFASVLTTSAQLEKLEEFIASNPEFQEDWKSVGEEALAIAKSNLKWLETHEDDLNKYYSPDEESDENNDEDNNNDNDDDKEDGDSSNSITYRPLACMLLISILVACSF